MGKTSKVRCVERQPRCTGLLLHHDLPALQPVGQLAGVSGVGKHCGVEDGQVFPCRAANRLRQQTGMALAVNPRPHSLAKRVVRGVQEVGLYFGRLAEVEQRCVASHPVHLSFRDDRHLLKTCITEQAPIPVVGRLIDRGFNRLRPVRLDGQCTGRPLSRCVDFGHDRGGDSVGDGRINIDISVIA